MHSLTEFCCLSPRIRWWPLILCELNVLKHAFNRWGSTEFHLNETIQTLFGTRRGVCELQRSPLMDPSIFRFSNSVGLFTRNISRGKNLVHTGVSEVGQTTLFFSIIFGKTWIADSTQMINRISKKESQIDYEVFLPKINASFNYSTIEKASILPVFRIFWKN